MISGSSQDSPLRGLQELQQKLNEQALPRPEKMEATRKILSDENYPAERLLNDIASLLASNLDQ